VRKGGYAKSRTISDFVLRASRYRLCVTLRPSVDIILPALAATPLCSLWDHKVTLIEVANYRRQRQSVAICSDEPGEASRLWRNLQTRYRE
jgi:hypothetical protein